MHLDESSDDHDKSKQDRNKCKITIRLDLKVMISIVIIQIGSITSNLGKLKELRNNKMNKG
jgi:hypothetical protein